jgi:hypothetical protein
MKMYTLINERADPPQEVARFPAENEQEAIAKALTIIDQNWNTLFYRILRHAGYRLEEAV